MANITYKVAKLGQPVVEYFEPNGDTNVAKALETAGFSSERYEIRVDGLLASPSTPVKNGSLVTLVPTLKAG